MLETQKNKTDHNKTILIGCQNNIILFQPLSLAKEEPSRPITERSKVAPFCDRCWLASLFCLVYLVDRIIFMGMNEATPTNLVDKIESEQQILTEKEKQDLAVVWERLGSGRKLPEGLSVTELRERMWTDCKDAYMKDVLPMLEFNKHRNFDLEQRIKETEHSSLRASLERQLLRQYVKELSREKHGWGTTPALSVITEGMLNCVGATGFLEAYLETAELDMDISCAKVSGHHVVMLTDSEKRNWYADARNDVFGEITAPGEKHPGGVSFQLNEKDQQNIRFPYNKLVAVKPAEGFIHANLNNIACIADNHVVYPGEYTADMRGLREDNQDILKLQDWSELSKKIFSKDLLDLIEHNDEWGKEEELIQVAEELHKEARGIVKEVLIKFSGKNEPSPNELEEISNKLHSAFVEYSDQIVDYFAQDDNLPSTLPENAMRALQMLRNKFKGLVAKPELQKYLLGMISSWVHRTEE